MSTPRIRFTIAAAVVMVAVVGLIAFALSGATAYYRTPAELKADPGRPDQKVRVAGKVVAGSVSKHGPITNFTVSDGKQDLEVTTQDVLPDIFGSNVDVVAEGAMTSGGVFSASTVLAKCPSKFKAKLQAK